MVRMGAKLCPEAQSRSVTRRRVNSTSQSGSGAVMMTSQTSSAAGGILLLQLANQLPGIGLGPGHAAPAGDDVAVIAEPDPAAGCADAVGVHDEVHGALGADRAVAGRVPAHQDLVVPQAQLAPPQVAAFLDRPAAGGGFDLDEFAMLVEVDRLSPNVLDAASGGLPTGPPVAGQVDPVARRPGQLADRDAQGLSDSDGDREDRLLLAGLVASD